MPPLQTHDLQTASALARWSRRIFYATGALLLTACASLAPPPPAQAVFDGARLFRHLLNLPLAYFQQRRHGEILALLTNDVARLAGYISGTLLSVVPLVLTVAGAALMMLRIDARLTLLVVLMIPLFYLLLKVLGRRLRPLSSQLQQAHADSVAIAEENLPRPIHVTVATTGAAQVKGEALDFPEKAMVLGPVRVIPREVPGLFFVGEAVDVTGWLGGYNFQWAWASGWAAGQAL